MVNFIEKNASTSADAEIRREMVDEDEEEIFENLNDLYGESSKQSSNHMSSSGKIRRRKPGIVYFSSIPPSMNVTTLRDYFSRYGRIERAYFQAIKDKSIKKSRGVMGKKLQFSEGWMEFQSKGKAIFVANHLNNQPVGGKKSNPDRDFLWNIKYLPRIKWAFLRQQLEHERETHRQRMNLEISQVRKEAEHYVNASEINEKLQKKAKKSKASRTTDLEIQPFEFKQKLTEEEILERKQRRLEKNEKYKNAIRKKKEKRKATKQQNAKKTDGFLESIFVGGGGS